MSYHACIHPSITECLRDLWQKLAMLLSLWLTIHCQTCEVLFRKFPLGLMLTPEEWYVLVEIPVIYGVGIRAGLHMVIFQPKQPYSRIHCSCALYESYTPASVVAFVAPLMDHFPRISSILLPEAIVCLTRTVRSDLGLDRTPDPISSKLEALEVKCLLGRRFTKHQI